VNIVNFEEVKKELQVAQEKVKKLSKNLSEADKLQDIILHQIEDSTFNACEGFKYSKALQEVRIKRRDIKNKLSEQQTIANLLKPFVKGYEKNQKNTYYSEVNGKKKYVKNLGEINNKISKL